MREGKIVLAKAFRGQRKKNGRTSGPEMQAKKERHETVSLYDRGETQRRELDFRVS